MHCHSTFHKVMDACAHQNIVSFVFLSSIFNCTAKDIGKIRIKKKRELRMINVNRVSSVMVLFVGIKFQSWVIEAHRAQRQTKERERIRLQSLNKCHSNDKYKYKSSASALCVCARMPHNTMSMAIFLELAKERSKTKKNRIEKISKNAIGIGFGIERVCLGTMQTLKLERRIFYCVCVWWCFGKAMRASRSKE